MCSNSFLCTRALRSQSIGNCMRVDCALGLSKLQNVYYFARKKNRTDTLIANNILTWRVRTRVHVRYFFLVIIVIFYSFLRFIEYFDHCCRNADERFIGVRLYILLLYLRFQGIIKFSKKFHHYRDPARWTA